MKFSRVLGSAAAHRSQFEADWAFAKFPSRRFQRLLGHSTVTIAVRYTHLNLGSKGPAVAKPASVRDSLVTGAPKYSNRNAQLSQVAG
jgi:hypothetical protein